MLKTTMVPSNLDLNNPFTSEITSASREGDAVRKQVLLCEAKALGAYREARRASAVAERADNEILELKSVDLVRLQENQDEFALESNDQCERIKALEKRGGFWTWVAIVGVAGLSALISRSLTKAETAEIAKDVSKELLDDTEFIQAVTIRVRVNLNSTIQDLINEIQSTMGYARNSDLRSLEREASALSLRLEGKATVSELNRAKEDVERLRNQVRELRSNSDVEDMNQRLIEFCSRLETHVEDGSMHKRKASTTKKPNGSVTT